MDDPDVLKLQKMLTDIAQSKPPVSKATIVEVSKAALTAIRHFKHVVHLIEKFILKCKSYHKLFGVYMIDSIVRQAQKKFKHKDVFGPRFAVNLRQTLENALTCPAKERPKIVRLLNLWSANNIFEEDTLRPLLQHCRASGLDVDAESVEKAVKGEKADMTRYGAGGLNISPMKAVSASASAVASAPSNSSSLNPAAFILKLLSSVNSDYDKVFSSNSRAFRKVQDLLTENVKKHLSSQSKNKIQNILSAEFDYSDDESGDENKTAVDITAIPQEQIDKTIESLFKNSKILDEIRSIYYENGGNDLHGSSSSKYDDRDRKRKRSRSLSRDKTSDRKRERSRRSKERERSRSHRRRSSSPPRHRDDKRDKERRKLGLPTDPKKEHLIIGSRTLWLGRLPQNCQENQIRNAMEEFGTIERIQVIQSKICAYVTMSDRRTAYKIIDKMSNKIEISRKFIKVSWATGQGLKDDNKLNVFWDAENGFHEIPWSSLPHRIGHLFEGGSVDLDTIPPKFKGMYDEKGKVIKPKSPERISEQPQQPNLSHVPLPPPENPIVQPPPQNFQPPPPQNFQLPPPSSMPTAVPPPMPIPNFQPGILPPGLNKDASANIEMLMAAVANGNNNNLPGILGPPPSTFNPALMNALNAAANVRTQLANLNRPPFPRHEGPLPDQQAAFQQFRGANPQRTFGNDFNNPGGFNPQIRTGFNNGNGFALPDMSNPPPNMGMNNPLPNMGERAPPMNFNIPPPIMNFAQPPPNLNLNPTQAEHQEEPMDIASPDGPPGV